MLYTIIWNSNKFWKLRFQNDKIYLICKRRRILKVIPPGLFSWGPFTQLLIWNLFSLTLNGHELADCNFQQYSENAVVGVLFFCHSIGFEYQWLKSFTSEIWYLKNLQLEFSEGFTLSTVSETTVISQAFLSFRSLSQNLIRLSIRTYCF